MIEITGTVQTGYGRGAKFVSLLPYKNAIKHVLGFNPYPGTLNVKLENEHEKEKFTKLLSSAFTRHIRSFKYQGKDYGGIVLIPIQINGIYGGIVAPDRTTHTGVLEILAPIMLRERLNLKDGDKVLIAKSMIHHTFMTPEHKEFFMELQRYKFIHGTWPKTKEYRVPFYSHKQVLQKLREYEANNLVSLISGEARLNPLGRSLFTIAFTGGVFDLLHLGHLHTLRKSKEYADFLLVVLARDQTSMKMKHKIPINNEDERLELMRAIRDVDAAILGRKTNYLQTINDILPDFIILGKDQSMNEDSITEYLDENALPFINVLRLDSEIDKRSTSLLIEKIKKRILQENNGF